MVADVLTEYKRQTRTGMLRELVLDRLQEVTRESTVACKDPDDGFTELFGGLP